MMPAGDLKAGERDPERPQKELPADREENQNGRGDTRCPDRDLPLLCGAHPLRREQEHRDRSDRTDQHPHHHELVDDVMELCRHRYPSLAHRAPPQMLPERGGRFVILQAWPLFHIIRTWPLAALATGHSTPVIST